MIRGMVGWGKLIGAVLGLAATLLVLPALAGATWPGQNGKVFFVCRAVGDTVSARDICSMSPDGSSLVNLTNTPDLNENTPEVSRDGRQVTFTRPGEGGTAAFVMNADGSNQRQVSFVPSDGPAWTPDGRIAYRAKVGESYEYQVVSASGGTPTRLFDTAVNGTSFSPRFTSSGAWLFGRFEPIPGDPLSFTQQIFVVNGESESQITVGAIGLSSNQQPSWSPDGSTILYWRSTGIHPDVWSVPSGGGTPVQVTDTGHPVAENWPSFSPDGSRMIWEQQDADHDFFHKHIVIANADGSSPVPVPTPSLTAAMNPVWAPVPTDPPNPKAAFTATAPKQVKKGKPVPVTLRCSGDTRCAVTYGAAVSVPHKGKKPKSFKIKAKSVTLNAKTNRTVKLKVPGGAKGLIAKALKAGKKPAIKVTATARQPGGPLIRKVILTVRIKK